MKSRAFIKAVAPQDLIVEAGEGGMLVYAADPNLARLLLKRFVLFPLVLLPFALLAYNIRQYNADLPMVDYGQLVHSPSAFFRSLPQDRAFWYFAFAPIPAAILLYTAELCRALRRPRMRVTGEGITLTAEFPGASVTRVDLAEVQEVQLRAYWRGGRGARQSHFLALALPEGVWDFLVSVEDCDAQAMQKLYTAADYIGRAYAKPVSHIDADGKTVEREPPP